MLTSAETPSPAPSAGTRRWGRSAPLASRSSLGLTTRQGALLAYSAGWISGLVLLTLEARDREVRLHAAQAFIGFGILTVVAVVLLVLAGVSLFSSLTLFRVCLWAAQGLIVVGLLLWAWALARVALGGSPRWPLVAGRAERLAGRG